MAPEGGRPCRPLWTAAGVRSARRRGGPSGVAEVYAGLDEVLQALNLATSAFDAIAARREQHLMRELKGIVTDIQQVAREAKIVSFNAQVIAARAGLAGREFGVVAGRLSDVHRRGPPGAQGPGPGSLVNRPSRQAAPRVCTSKRLLRTRPARFTSAGLRLQLLN